MRDSGYKSTGTAIDELVDNSIQAGAQRVDVIFETISPKGKQREKSETLPFLMMDTAWSPT